MIKLKNYNIMNNQPSFIAILPANVRYNKNLSDAAKLLFAEITSLSDKEGYCWANNAYFAELYGKTTRTISKIISDLEKLGFLELKFETNKNGTVRKMYPFGGGGRKLLGGWKKTSRGVEENFHHININNNISNNIDNTLCENSHIASSQPSELSSLSLKTKEKEKEKKVAPKKEKEIAAFRQAIEHLNKQSGKAYRMTDNDLAGKTDKFKLFAKVLQAYTLEEILQVIDDRCAAWKEDKRMVQYLRPATIFALRNFEKYLEDIKAGTPENKIDESFGQLRSSILSLGYKLNPNSLKTFVQRITSLFPKDTPQSQINEKALFLLGTDAARKYTSINAVTANINIIIKEIKQTA
jgi:uncharacterized phage protein (TIGR02220 family)